MQNLVGDHDSCIDCKKCMQGCPMLHEFTDSPKNLLQSFKISMPSSHISFSCATCNYCFSVCPKDISFKEVFFNAKSEHAKEDSVLYNFGYKSILFHQKNSFSKYFSAKTKFYEGKYKNMAFMPGCALSSYSPDIVKNVYKHLNSLLPGINVLQQCCAQPTRIVGDMVRFRELYSILQADIDTLKVDTVVTACENCYMSLKQYSPKVKVISLYEVLADIGIPKEKENSFGHFEKVALHDPCPTRYETNLQDSVRAVLDLLGLPYVEFKANREKTECCGSGGMLELTNQKLAQKQMTSRANQTTCKSIISYCQSCAESMNRGGKNGLHILDLIFSDIDGAVFKQKKNGLVRKWYNRHKSKKMVEKL